MPPGAGSGGSGRAGADSSRRQSGATRRAAASRRRCRGLRVRCSRALGSVQPPFRAMPVAGLFIGKKIPVPVENIPCSARQGKRPNSVVESRLCQARIGRFQPRFYRYSLYFVRTGNRHQRRVRSRLPAPPQIFPLYNNKLDNFENGGFLRLSRAVRARCLTERHRETGP